MLKNKEVNVAVAIETALAGNLEETVDVEVARMVAEKPSDSDGFTSADGGCDRSSCDAKEGWEEV
jgi:hypothetical protein